MYLLHLLIKSPIFPMYIQAVELCNKFYLHYHIYYNISKDPFYRRKRVICNDEVPLSNKMFSKFPPPKMMKYADDYLFKI